MLQNGGLRLFLPKMQALYHSGWHPSNIYSCWNCTKEVIQTAKIDIKITYIMSHMSHNSLYLRTYLEHTEYISIATVTKVSPQGVAIIEC